VTDAELDTHDTATETVILPEPAVPPAAHPVLGPAWEMVQTVVLAVALFFLIRNFIQNYKIDGISMEPNFHHGQFLIVNRYSYCPGFHFEVPPLEINLDKVWCVRLPRRGDVVVFEYPLDPSRDFIKRVIGLPGDTVEVRNGTVFVNGQQLAEPFGPNPGSYTAEPVTVPPGQLFVLGDNRNNSSDSHVWGELPLELVIGKALVSYWPPKNWSIVPHFDLSGATGEPTAP
jgi:signal peptidase I